MKRTAAAVLVTALAAIAEPASAHPAPFSYLDVRIERDVIDVGFVAHIYDVSHDLNVAPQERLLDSAFLSEQRDAIVALLGPRLALVADGVTLVEDSWSSAEALPDRQAIRLHARFPRPRAPSVLSLDAAMFPYDPAHQTFVNVYEGGQLTLQAILDSGKTRLDYYSGSRQGALAVAQRFVSAGVRHIVFGADHLVFLVGLLLLGASVRHMGLLAGAFIAADAVVFLLTALHLLSPPTRIIEPAVALGIAYIGVDNLMVRGGRDTRPWIAFAFGLIHGFWFAGGLRASDLPPWALTWSLVAFDAGVQLAQLLIVWGVGSAIIVLRHRHSMLAGRLATIGSWLVIVAGAFWFIQRVFFSGGLI